ncbi:uncharacterized protein PRCAT00003963001 [Priceomyces carsonii]|uniref:uncharacterized protein n=1 Tax=Priceomyces carsonii TaxID=28549 RepID=UPI002ED793A4|nr:unnamed protein product [Priceomyces carsonii]
MKKRVPGHLRKKALFSCDRCRLKKRACKRETNGNSKATDVDLSVPCTGCANRGLECKTTLPRKRRSHVTDKTLGLHYKYLYAIAQAMLPNVDINNMDYLRKVGSDMGITMPSFLKKGTENDEELADIGRLISPNSENTYSRSHEEIFEGDKFILDNHGVSHYVGPMGTAALLASTSSFMMDSNEMSTLFALEFQKVYESDAIVSSTAYSNSDSINSKIDPTSDTPYVPGLHKSFCNTYKEVFFEKLYIYYPCMRRERFEDLYEKFWHETGECKYHAAELTLDQICCIYAVLVLGYCYHRQFFSSGLDDPIIPQLLKRIVSSISSLILLPTLDGILSLLLLAIYYGKNKKRECSYLLLEISCKQALAIGLSRQSMIECIADENVKDQMKRLWWVLFLQEVKMCKLLGRVSSVSLQEVNVDYPSFELENEVGAMFLCSIKLIRVVHQFPEIASSTFEENTIKTTCSIIDHVEKSLLKWYVDFEKCFTNVSKRQSISFRFRLMLEYHYYHIYLLFASIVHLCEKKTAVEKKVIDLAARCVHSGIKISEILIEGDAYTILNSFWSPHANYAFLSTLCLSRVFIWMQNVGITSLNYDNIHISKEDIQKSMISVREYNKGHIFRWTGSSVKLSKYTEVLLKNFKFIIDKSPVGNSEIGYDAIGAGIVNSEAETANPANSSASLGMAPVSPTTRWDVSNVSNSTQRILNQNELADFTLEKLEGSMFFANDVMGL